MPKPNTTFDLSVKDLELIETALRKVTSKEAELDQKDVHDLLGRLHNQKTFYRPRAGVYVSG